MSIIEVQPLLLKDVEATIGTDDFRKHLSAVTFTPSAEKKTWAGMGRNTHTDVSEATWEAGLNYVQDWDSPTSLSRYLYENEGETVEMTFRPRSGSGPSFTAEIVITPGAIGGQVNSFAETSVTLGCNGKPLLVAVP